MTLFLLGIILPILEIIRYHTIFQIPIIIIDILLLLLYKFKDKFYIKSLIFIRLFLFGYFCKNITDIDIFICIFIYITSEYINNKFFLSLSIIEVIFLLLNFENRIISILLWIFIILKFYKNYILNAQKLNNLNEYSNQMIRQIHQIIELSLPKYAANHVYNHIINHKEMPPLYCEHPNVVVMFIKFIIPEQIEFEDNPKNQNVRFQRATYIPEKNNLQKLDRVIKQLDNEVKSCNVFKVEHIGYSYIVSSMNARYDYLKPDFDILNEINSVAIFGQRASRICKMNNIDIFIGMHVGPVAAGLIGKTRTFFRLFGDTINTASRMQSTSTEPNLIHMTDNCFKLLNENIVQNFKEQITDVKGKGNMKTYLVELKPTKSFGKTSSNKQQPLQKSFKSREKLVSLVSNISNNYESASEDESLYDTETPTSRIRKSTIVEIRESEIIKNNNVKPLSVSHINSIQKTLDETTKLNKIYNCFKNLFTNNLTHNFMNNFMNNITNIFKNIVPSQEETYKSMIFGIIQQIFIVIINFEQFQNFMFSNIILICLINLYCSSYLCSQNIIQIVYILLRSLSWCTLIGNTNSILLQFILLSGNDGMMIRNNFIQMTIGVAVFLINNTRMNMNAHVLLIILITLITEPIIQYQHSIMTDLKEKIDIRIQQEKEMMSGILSEKVMNIMNDDDENIIQLWASVLHLDIVGFTNLSSNLTPVEVAQFLHYLYDRFDTIVNRYNLYKVDTVGDAYIVIRSIDGDINRISVNDRKKACIDMINCAREMLEEVDDINLNLTYKIKIRVGISAGLLTGAVLGELRPRFHVYGSVLKEAEYFESSATPGNIVISPSINRFVEYVYSLEKIMTKPNSNFEKYVGQYNNMAYVILSNKLKDKDHVVINIEEKKTKLSPKPEINRAESMKITPKLEPSSHDRRSSDIKTLGKIRRKSNMININISELQI